MAKPPAALPLYVEDFLHGTDTFTNEEVGAYLRLLAYQWEHGHVPADDRVTLAALLHESIGRASQLWPRVAVKFTRGPDARWRNVRLDRERAAAVDYSARQQARARLRWSTQR